MGIEAYKSGERLLAQGQFEEAVSAFRTALAHAPQEDKVFVLADRAADYAAELVLVVPALGCSGIIIGEVVRIQDAIAEIVVNVAVPLVRSATDGGIDYATGLMAVGRVIRGGNGGKLLNRVDTGGKIPLAAVVADDSPVQHEHVVAVSGARTVEIGNGV